MHEELLCILLSAGGEFRVTAPYYWLKHLRSNTILFLRNKPNFKSLILPIHTSLRGKRFRSSYCGKVGPRGHKTGRRRRGEGFPFLSFPSLFFYLFSSRSTFLDELAQKHTQANPILAVCTSNGRYVQQSPWCYTCYPFILKFHYICRGSIVYTYLTITRPK